MKIRNLLLAGLVPVLAWSCSDDKLQGGENTPPSTASQNYMEVSIKMPITTRTASPSTETEDGQDYENSVKEVLVVVVNVKEKEQEGRDILCERGRRNLLCEISGYSTKSR